MAVDARSGKGSAAVKAKHQRLILALAGLGAVLGSGVLAMSAIGDRASYFYAPEDIARDGIPQGRAIRLGGMVTKDSIFRATDGVTMTFIVMTRKAKCPFDSRVFRPICSRKGRESSPKGCSKGARLSPATFSPNMMKTTCHRKWPVNSTRRIH